MTRLQTTLSIIVGLLLLPVFAWIGLAAIGTVVVASVVVAVFGIGFSVFHASQGALSILNKPSHR